MKKIEDNEDVFNEWVKSTAPKCGARMARDFLYCLDDKEWLINFVSKNYTKYVIDNFGLKHEFKVPFLRFFKKNVVWFDWSSSSILKSCVRNCVTDDLSISGIKLKPVPEYMRWTEECGNSQNNLIRSLIWISASEKNLGPFTTCLNQRFDLRDFVRAQSGIIYMAWQADLLYGSNYSVRNLIDDIAKENKVRSPEEGKRK